MTDRELLAAALNALNLINHRGNTDDELMQVGQTITQIQERLTEPEPEPVAWMDDTGHCVQASKAHPTGYPKFQIPLYRHPPRPTGLDQLLERIRFLEQQIAERTNPWTG